MHCAQLWPASHRQWNPKGSTLLCLFTKKHGQELASTAADWPFAANLKDLDASANVAWSSLPLRAPVCTNRFHHCKVIS